MNLLKSLSNTPLQPIVVCVCVCVHECIYIMCVLHVCVQACVYACVYACAVLDLELDVMYISVIYYYIVRSQYWLQSRMGGVACVWFVFL